ncbi:ankyrin repeat domain-containing protein SOWAHB [Spea bombifrons]|uniref:ankyrin repeat domain-containing protein SOWAHB n=1 Tax=Spea bombifrons TaxID=233779 RepID=UPI00234B953A|nr:ankyrin repeat domain-containing protein SOWAHB [Spea bombifrons]
MMAKALSQEEVLDFLCQGGGKVPNASLLAHFKGFLRDPQVSAEQLLKHRERFKRFVNSVAVVKQEGGVKYVVLRSKYQDLLGEDLRPPTPPDLGHQPGRVGDSSRADRGESSAVRGQACTGPQVGERRNRHPAELEGSGQQAGWEVNPETSGHLRQINVTPPHKHPGSREITGAVNGKAWDASSPKGHLTPDLTPTSSRSPKDLSPPPKSISSPNSSASSYSPLPNEPSPASRSPRRQESKTDTANPAFVSATYRDLQEQRQGCMSCSECNQLSVQLKGSLPQEVHFAHEQPSNVYREQPCDSLYQGQPVVLSSSRYMNTDHPSPSLLLPHESDIPPPDVLLAEYEPVSPDPSPPLPYNELHGMWMLDMPIFKSIRCQLSLQDLEDFVDQESCGSDGSDSGEGGDCDTEHRDEEEISSDSNNEKYDHFIEPKSETSRSCPSNTKVLSIIEQYNKPQRENSLGIADKARVQPMTPRVLTETHKSPYIAKSFLTDQAPILFELAGNVPRNRTRAHLRENMSSSDDELLDREYRKRRRPSRSKKSSNIAVVAPPPDIDRLLTVKSVTSNSFVVNDQLPFGNQNTVTLHVPKGQKDCDHKKNSNYKSSLVPLDPLEHDWLVKSASGSWLQVYGLFNMDPNLALRKDFISGYTVLHWLAKHGCMEMFQKVVAGAKKAGIELDMNVKTSCGYTALHIAAIHGHHKVATMLVEKLKVNVKLRDNSGKRAWQYLSCTTSGEVWQLLGAPRGKTIFPAQALPIAHSINAPNRSAQLNRKTSLAAFLKPQHQKWRANNLPALREREIYSD